MIEAPQSFVVREECEKAAWHYGYRRALGEHHGWAAFGSTTAQGTLWLAASGSQGPWYLALEHPGVVREWGVPPVDIVGPGMARYTFPNLTELYTALPRLYQLAFSLPDAPLNLFRAETDALPRTTETERLVVQRIGQGIFRDSLLDYWQGRCPLTGITEPALLRASHIIPWSECPNYEMRLDVYNGLLLSALWDAAFDRALVTFDDSGLPMFSSNLSHAARQALGWSSPLPITDLHRVYLQHHRRRFESAT